MDIFRGRNSVQILFVLQKFYLVTIFIYDYPFLKMYIERLFERLRLSFICRDNAL